jgi:hypothetical protein
MSLGLVGDQPTNQVWSFVMVEQLSETMPEDVRQAFSDAVRLYGHWRSEPPKLSSPTLAFRTLNVSLSGLCDLVAAYKNEPLPLAVHDELWTLIEEMKLKAELAIDPSYATGPESSTPSFKVAGQPLITERLTRRGRLLHLMTSPSFETAPGAQLPSNRRVCVGAFPTAGRRPPVFFSAISV